MRSGRLGDSLRQLLRVPRADRVAVRSVLEIPVCAYEYAYYGDAAHGNTISTCTDRDL